jgi:transcription initiation factor TFIIIB Brf1 subunit/transcription initiation factor TFIIB
VLPHSARLLLEVLLRKGLLRARSVEAAAAGKLPAIFRRSPAEPRTKVRITQHTHVVECLNETRDTWVGGYQHVWAQDLNRDRY